jgi:hypothetical protein
VSAGDSDDGLLAKGIAKPDAILIADVVDHSRHIRVDQEGTLLRFQTCRRDLIDPQIDVRSRRAPRQPLK